MATLVAGEASPSRVFEQVTEEVGRLLGLPGASVIQYDGAHTATVVGAWSEHGPPRFPVGVKLDLDGDTVIAKVVRSGSPQRVERYEQVSGTLAEDGARRWLSRRRRGAGERRREALGRAGGGDHVGRRDA